MDDAQKEKERNIKEAQGKIADQQKIVQKLVTFF